MRTSTAITAAVAITLCLLAIRWQRSHISLLVQETHALRDELSAAPSHPGLPSPRVGTSGAVRRSHRGRNDGTVSRGIPSLARLRALWPAGTVSTDRSAATLLIPKLVAAVEHCSSAELLELAAGLSDHPEKGSFNEPFLQELMLIMVSEEDPAGALVLWDRLFAGTKRTESVRASILSELARKNPKLALAKWDREGMGRHGQSRCRLAVAQQLLRSDPAAGLNLLQEDLGAGWGHGLNGILYAPHDSRIAIAAAARDPQVKAFLWQKANAPRTKWNRLMILGGLIQNAEIEGGLPAISTLLTRIENLSDDQRNKLLKKRWTYPSPSTTDFLGMLELFREHATGDYRKETLRSSMSVWARSDPNAAGRWLAKQSPSDDRDEMIAGYAKQVVEIDPDGAAAWVARISNEEVRAEALKTLRLLFPPEE